MAPAQTTNISWFLPGFQGVNLGATDLDPLGRFAYSRPAMHPTPSPMLYPTLRLFSVALALCGVLAAAGGEPLQLAPKEGVLLLRNQNVVRGKISRVADHYLVAVPGGEIRIRASEVELFCDNLDEGYRRKHAAMQQGNAAQHLALAEWCVRQGLLGYAARELYDARTADPTHPRIALVERRLRRTSDVAAVNKVKPPRPNAVPRATSAKELDAMMRRLPPGAVEMFTTTIQPLLLNSCSTVGCHRRGSDVEMRLQRNGSRPINRRMTQHNLHALLQQIDKDRPDQSPLLTKASAPHARDNDGRTKLLDREKFERLAQWVRIATNRDVPQATTVDKPTAELMQTIAGVGTRADVTQNQQTPPRAPLSKGGAAQKDPFDPAVFNRRHASPRR